MIIDDDDDDDMLTMTITMMMMMLMIMMMMTNHITPYPPRYDRYDVVVDDDDNGEVFVVINVDDGDSPHPFSSSPFRQSL